MECASPAVLFDGGPHIVAQALNLALQLDKASILLRLGQRADGGS
jgi:hypothetical protein